METRGMTRGEAEMRVDMQPPQEEKIARADVVLDNASSLRGLWSQVINAWNAIPGVPTHVEDVAWERLWTTRG
jgi:dephospho-CoA kinase